MRGIIVSLNKPYTVATQMYGNESFEENILYVDCASALAGILGGVTDSNNVITVSPVTLSDISIAISEATKRFDNGIFVVFDSITTLLIYYPESEVLKFLHITALKLRQLTDRIAQTEKTAVFFMMVDQQMGKEMVSALSTVFDGFMHLNKE